VGADPEQEREIDVTDVRIGNTWSTILRSRAASLMIMKFSNFYSYSQHLHGIGISRGIRMKVFLDFWHVP
jgi:hypothetical protein